MLERWTRTVIRHRNSVLITWVFLALLGALAGSKIDKHLTTSLTIPNSQSARASEILNNAFHENIEGTFTVVLKVGKATPPEIEIIKEKIASAASTIPTAKVTQEKVISGSLFANIGTGFTLLDAASYTEKLRVAVAASGLTGALITGPPAIEHDISPVLSSDLHRGQALAIFLAFLLLILMLGFTWAIAIPLIFATATISVTLAMVYLIAQKFLMVLYIPNIIELIGLGLAIDYSLLILHRYRGEMKNQNHSSPAEAISRTLHTAGRTILISGLSVSVGLATLLLMPIPFIRSLGVAGVMVPIIAILAAFTLQPALLSYLSAERLESKGFQGLLSQKGSAQGPWGKVTTLILRRPKTILILSLAVLGTLASALIWLQPTPSSLTSIPSSLESSRALSLVTQRVGVGIITPNEIVIDLGRSNQASSPIVDAARLKLSKQLLTNPEVFVVATGQKDPYVDPTGRYLRIFVIGHHSFGAEQSQNLLRQIRSQYISQAIFPQGTKIYVGGAPAQGVDLLDKVHSVFPWLVLLALLLAFLILVRAFNSLILPIKAIVMDLVSVAVGYGCLVLVFRFGIGKSLLGTYQVDQIEIWVLVFLFAMLFGLSMDYEIFIVSRIREAHTRGASNSEAIIEGISQTGGVVSGAAFIFVGALGGMVFGHFAGLQELGIGLALAVLIDATIIRGLLLPSVMVLLGRWNWWLPTSVAHLLKTKASPLEDSVARL